MKQKLVYPKGLSLKPFQEDCIHNMLEFLEANGGCYNGCEMRLGKSIQSLVAVNSFTPIPDGIILIIAPSSVRLVWRDEVRRWMEHEPLVLLKGNQLKKEKAKDIVIVSYDIARTEEFIKWVKKVPIAYLIADEAHYLSNLKSLRTKAVLKKIWPLAKYKIALSGTPFKNNVVDAYSLFHKFAPDMFTDWYSFANTFANRKHNGFGVVYEGLKNHELLKHLIYSKFFLRKTQKEVFKEMPEKQYIKVPIESSYAVRLTAEEKEALRQYHAELRALLQNDSPMTKVKPPPVAVMKLRREQGIKKVKPIVEYIKNMLEQDVPLVLVCTYMDTINEYMEAFKGYKPALIRGDVSATKRHAEIKRFREGKTPLIILQIVAGSVGVDLSNADDILIADIPYSFVDLAQVCARCDNMEKKRTVNIHYAIVDESSDEKVLDQLMGKVKNFNKVFN